MIILIANTAYNDVTDIIHYKTSFYTYFFGAAITEDTLLIL